MLAVVSDTHGTDDHRLTGRTLEAVRDAEAVIHAGDFTTTAVLDAFYEEADRLYPVHGNADDPAVRERLPDARSVEFGGVRFAVTHRRDGGAVGLAMFGRERAADVVVHGHSHRPRAIEARGVTLLNPGSHADPRGNRPGHAEIEATDDGVAGTIYEPDGSVIERFTVDAA